MIEVVQYFKTTSLGRYPTIPGWYGQSYSFLTTTHRRLLNHI